jgi:hypothetical protein
MDKAVKETKEGKTTPLQEELIRAGYSCTQAEALQYSQ